MTRGIFTLPLLAMDAPVGSSASGVADSRPGGPDSRPGGPDSRPGGPGDVGFPFIAGPENALLQILVDAVSSVSPEFNPITLYGPTGVGKSHLLHGLMNRMRSLMPDRRVYSATGSDFARMFARSVELDTLAELRERFVASDVFLIDGVQELASKRGAQQELLAAVDGALERNALLLFSCNAPPAEWSWMLAALRSRLSSGLIIPVAAPSAGTRHEIVRRLAERFELVLSNELVEQLARDQSHPFAAPSTFPQLRSLVMQLATGSACGVDDRCRPVSSDHQPRSHEESTRRIAKLVAKQFDLKLGDLLGSSRRHSVVRARGIAMYLARSILALSYEQLGQEFGGRDHTTVLHAYRKIVDDMTTDHILKQTVDKLISQLATPVAAAQP